ncbi:MAG: hypothetical protein ACYSUD_12570 [Planctomycetota bacterium]
MPVDQTWNPTTTELMKLFRESLTRLLPVMEKAHLSWQEEEAYDEWDQIATSLFEGIVVSSLRWGLTPGVLTELEVPAYDVVYPDYAEFSFIECLSDSPESDDHLLFHKFVTNEAPFDMIRCYQVNNRGQKLTPDPEIRPVADARFAFCLRRSPDELIRYERLTIRYKN